MTNKELINRLLTIRPNIKVVTYNNMEEAVDADHIYEFFVKKLPDGTYEMRTTKPTVNPEEWEEAILL